MKEQRRLAAIVSADVVGYSRLMGQDESGTLAALKALRRELVDPKIAAHGGRIVKTTGDGMLLEFPSVVDAVRCVVELQTAMAARDADTPEDRRIALRVGVNLGDIIIEGDDIFGDGVNIAARLQEIAKPGGVAISRRVHEDVRDRLDAAFEDAGEIALKNIARPVPVWRWSPDGAPVAATARAAPTEPPLALPDKPSIAVLPFANMSGDPEQEYFTDGISEDIITELSRFRSLFVIARNSSFTYKGKSIDIKQVGRELGVRYVLEGSIRRAANRVRVTAQLIDATTGSHIWAEKYDRVLEDIFAVQEEVTQAIVAAIAPHIETSEFTRLHAVRPGSLGAYELAMRGWSAAWQTLKDPDADDLRDEALRCAREALAIDPASSAALRAIAFASWQQLTFRPATLGAVASREGLEAARKAIAIDSGDHVAHLWRGFLLLYSGKFEAALADLKRALELNPNDAFARAILGYAQAMDGHPQEAIALCERALRLSPRDPARYVILNTLGWAHFSARDYARGAAAHQHSVNELSRLPHSRFGLIVNCVGAGELERARMECAALRELAPEFFEARLAGGVAASSPEIRKRATTFVRVAAGIEDPSAADALR